MKNNFDMKLPFTSKKIIPILLFIMIIGISLVLLSDSLSSSGDSASSPDTETVINQTDNSFVNINMELKLKKILSSIKGVGNVEVLINYKTTSEKIVLKENEGGQNEKTVTTGVGNDADPFVKMEKAAGIEGVIIVADGGGDTYVCIEIAEAVSALLNLPVHKIKVLEMKG